MGLRKKFSRGIIWLSVHANQINGRRSAINIQFQPRYFKVHSSNLNLCFTFLWKPIEYWIHVQTWYAIIFSWKHLPDKIWYVPEEIIIVHQAEGKRKKQRVRKWAGRSEVEFRSTGPERELTTSIVRLSFFSCAQTKDESFLLWCCLFAFFEAIALISYKLSRLTSFARTCLENYARMQHTGCLLISRRKHTGQQLLYF